MRYEIEGSSQQAHSRDFAFRCAHIQAEHQSRPVRVTALGVRLSGVPAETMRDLENLLTVLVSGEGPAAPFIADLIDGPEFWQPVSHFTVHPDGTVEESP